MTHSSTGVTSQATDTTPDYGFICFSGFVLFPLPLSLSACNLCIFNPIEHSKFKHRRIVSTAVLVENEIQREGEGIVLGNSRYKVEKVGDEGFSKMAP